MYLSPFIPDLSTLTYLAWNRNYDVAFQCIKDAVVSDTTLRYFNPSLPLTIQVDASQVGLDVALLQNHKTIAFASKALTKAKHHYTNIEREMLAVIFGAERFSIYIYGRSFTIESDHKPLESISQKNLLDTSAQVQHMLLCLQGYDNTIHYCPVRKWPCSMTSLASVLILTPTFH